MSELVQLLRAACVVSTSRADVATLESAIEILEQQPLVCGELQLGACLGPIHERACADCGHAIARCEAHGGRKSVSRCMWLHRERNHHQGKA
jgi:hypothetical protein